MVRRKGENSWEGRRKKKHSCNMSLPHTPVPASRRAGETRSFDEVPSTPSASLFGGSGSGSGTPFFTPLRGTSLSHTPAPVSPLKQLLASASKPSAPVSVPAANKAEIAAAVQTFDGKWETPKLRQVEQVKRTRAFSDTDASRLVANSVALVALFLLWLGGYIELLASFASYLSNGDILVSYIFYAFATIILVNIGTVVPKLFRDPPGPKDFAKVPLTPREKVLLGLEKSGAPSTQQQQQTFTSNNAAPKYTPSKSSFRGSSGSIGGSVFSTPLTRTTPGAFGKSSAPGSAGAAGAGGNISNPQTQYSTPTPAAYVQNSPMSAHLLGTSPSIRDSTPIRSQKTLLRLLAESEPQTTPSSNTPRTPTHPASPFPNPALSSMPLSAAGKFQPAAPASPLTALGTLAKQDRMEGGFVVKAPDAVHAALGPPGLVDAWAEGMRWWISRRVVKRLAERLEACEEALRTQGWGHLGVGEAVWRGEWGVCGWVPPVQQQQQQQQGGGLFGASKPAGGSLFGGGFGATTTTQSGGLFGGSNAFGGFGTSSLGQAQLQPQQKPANLWEMQQRFGQTPLCQERLKIEGYLNIPDYNCREYILERIHALSKSGGLAAYNWNAPTASKSANPFSSSLSSVMDFFGSPSNTSSSMSSSIFGRSGAASLNFDSSTLSSQPGGSSGLNASTSSQNPAGSSNPSGSTSNSSTPIKVPSDAELVMHLVCRFFDEQMGSPGAFSYKYVIPLDAKPDSTVSIQIQTKSRSPPHYNLVYRGRIWEMYAKRNNVFHVLAVFAYIVSTTAGGYLGLLNLGGKGVGMVTETGILDGPGRSAFLEEEEERRRKLRASHLQEVEAEAGTGSISGGIGGKENVDTVGSGSKSISFGESLGGGKRKF